ncbi:MAG: hypothetical protein C5B58_08265 [Acidobacteria bacterium]|nr:MAG: hypothetical protein C5B58_08265 [Acidobacteriota bacterium]
MGAYSEPSARQHEPQSQCCVNAVAESFFATLKIELAYQTRWSTRTQARSEVFDYIEIF